MLKNFSKKSYTNLIKNMILFSFIAFLCSIIIILPQASASGVITGLRFCSEILVPSLFPFMVLSSLIVKTGISEKLGKVFSPAVKNIFHLPSCTAATIILSLIGGYPTFIHRMRRPCLRFKCCLLALFKQQNYRTICPYFANYLCYIFRCNFWNFLQRKHVKG